ncbi:MAG: serine hydrolase [Candidatus Aminicenantes bacterium]|nr:serine hydrolase [Candidatus Aminicenantes bacterium]
MNISKSITILMSIIFVLISFTTCNTKEEISERDIFIEEGSYTGSYWPTTGWRSCSPDEVGMDSESLKLVYDYIANPSVNTEGIVVIRRGYIIAEAYFGEFSQNSRHSSYSVAKSFISALIGISISENYITGINNKVFNYFPAWDSDGIDPRKKNISIKHLLTMSSGLEWNEANYYTDISRNDVFIMVEENDYIQYVLDKPSEFEPGTIWRYSSGDSMLLSGIIQQSTGMTAYQYAMGNLFGPIGISGVTWESDRAGHTVGGWGINATVREYAKFGYLYLNSGEWDGLQIVPESWVEQSKTPVTSNIDYYGFQGWLATALQGFNNSDIPSDLFLAWGIFTQQIFVIPSLDLVIVRVANDPGSPEWDEVQFLTLIINSIQ